MANVNGKASAIATAPLIPGIAPPMMPHVTPPTMATMRDHSRALTKTPASPWGMLPAPRSPRHPRLEEGRRRTRDQEAHREGGEERQRHQHGCRHEGRRARAGLEEQDRDDVQRGG